MTEQKKPTWTVADWCTRTRVRVGARGTNGTVLGGIEFDSDQPLLAASDKVAEMMGQQIGPAMLADPDVRRFVLLRRKRTQIRKSEEENKLLLEQLDTEKKRLVLAAYSDDQAKRLGQIEHDKHGYTSRGNDLARLARETEKQLQAARSLAERALRRFLDDNQAKAIAHYDQLRGRLLAQLCLFAGDVLTALSEALQCLTAAGGSADGFMFRFVKLLDTLDLPDGPTDAAPLPPPEPAPPAPNVLPNDGRPGILSAPPPPRPPRQGQVDGWGNPTPWAKPPATEPPAPQAPQAPQAPEPAAAAAPVAESTESPAEPQASEDEPRKGKRRTTAKVE